MFVTQKITFWTYREERVKGAVRQPVSEHGLFILYNQRDLRSLLFNFLML